MKSIFDKFNLRPQEQRLVVVVATILFIVLNVWLVFPHFSEWGRTTRSMDDTRKTLKKYQDEIAKRPAYEAQLKDLQGDGGIMLTDDLEFQRIVRSQANVAGLHIVNLEPRAVASSRANEFFQEQALTVQFDGDDKQLVDFMVNIAATNAMIRAREFSVKPDASQTRLVGTVLLIANYNHPQKAALPKSAPSTKKAPLPKPASASSKSLSTSKTASPNSAKPNLPPKKIVPPKVVPPSKAVPQGKGNNSPAKKQ